MHTYWLVSLRDLLYSMNIKTATIATLQLLLVFVLTSCAHVYKAPDATKVKAATALVKEDQKKTQRLNKEIGEAIKTSQEHTDAIIVIGNSLAEKIDSLIKVAPPEIQSALADIKGDASNLQKRDQALFNSLSLAYTKQEEQQVHIAKTDEHVATLEGNQIEYFNNSKKLADTATTLSAKVAWYQWHWWGSWFVLIAGIVLSIVFALFRWGSKWAIKLGLKTVV